MQIDYILRDQLRTLNINDCHHPSNRLSTIRNTDANANNQKCDYNPDIRPAWEMKWIPTRHSAFNNNNNEASYCNNCGCIMCTQCGNVDYDDSHRQSTKNTEGGNSINHGSRRNNESSKNSSNQDNEDN